MSKSNNMWPWIIGGGALLGGLALLASGEKAAGAAAGRAAADRVVSKATQERKAMQGTAKALGNTAINSLVPGLGVFFPKGVLR